MPLITSKSAPKKGANAPIKGQRGHTKPKGNKKDDRSGKNVVRKQPSHSQAVAIRGIPSARSAASTLKYMNLDGPDNIQRQYMQVAGVEGNSSEIKYRITEFFDIEADTQIANYWWKYQQSLTASASPSSDFNSSGTAWSRPVKAKLYVLPRSEPAANASNTFALSSGIPMRLLPDSGTTDSNTLANTACKVVQPDFNVEWRHVATFDYDKAFSDALIVPHTTDTGASICLFQAAAVDVDTGDNFAQDVQCMLVLDVAQNVPAMCQVTAGSTNGATWGDPSALQSNITAQFALVQPYGASNRT